ncbi:cytochrome P450 CYP72A616-like [Malania oleifera]|uniref:cytochrome P450 CYP72A616-like n=1 Tax=Malania oleifera TaxID=397392 RepID=UPI0025AEC1F1|nr:cytochrome P450 CYP72A616-like [Malania oleifera]
MLAERTANKVQDMDFTPLSLVLLFSPFLLICCAVRFSYTIWWKPKWLEKRLRQQGIQGTPYRYLIGDMKELVNLTKEAWSKPINLNHQIVPRVDPFTHNIVHRYGNVSLSWNGKTPRLIIKDPEMMKEVMSNKQGHLQKPPLNPFVLILSRGLATQVGEVWAEHRRIINPAFHLDKLKGMIPAFTASCSTMIEQWKKSASLQGTCGVDVWTEFQDLTGDIISRTAFGSNYEEGKKILELQKELQVLAIEAMRTLYIPGYRFIPTEKNRRRKMLDKKITSMLRNLVERKEELMQSGESRVDDLLGLLLQSNKQSNYPENTSGTKCNGMTIDEVIEECKLFYLAGHETTASLLTWTTIVLAMHPDWQEKAREEVAKICRKGNPDFEAISHLKIVTMILYEVLRLYPPAIALYQHAYKETKTGDISVPAGVDITLPLLLTNHDPELWGEDAEEFKSERFSNGVSKASKSHLAFFPFGWGPRTCIGQNFAMIEAKVSLAMILQHFSLELSPSYTHAPYTVMILQPQHGAQITIRRL